MTRISMRGRGVRRARFLRSRWFVVAAAFAALAACNTDQLLNANAPDRVPASTIDDPKQAALMVNSAVGDFECAAGSYTLVEALISDEFSDAQLGAAGWPYDRRDAGTQTAGIYGTNPCDNNQNPGVYTPLSTARWSSDNALTKLQGWSDADVGPDRTDLMAQAALYAGYSYTLMGMSMCEAAFDLGAPVDQMAMFALAEDRFGTAISDGQTAGDQAVVNAAYVGRARVRLYQGNTQGAASDAALVPSGFELDASTGSDDNRRYNRVYAATAQFGDYTVDPQSRNLLVGPTVYSGGSTAGFVSDPRAAVVQATTRAADPTQTIFYPTKYSADDSPLPIATYTEAQLILAEATGGAGAVTIINALRDAVGVPHYTGATDAASITALVADERRRALFAEGFRNYDIQRFNLPLIPAPGTAFSKGGFYGNTTCLALPDVERYNNPNVH